MQVTIHGELVHNPVVNERLAARGFRFASEEERDRPAGTAEVLITAHGVSNRRRQRLLDQGHTLHDTTCPLVRKAHDAAMRLAAEGRFVIVIGKAGHVEVQGFVEDLAEHAVVSNVASVRKYPSLKLGVICQTTCPPADAEQVHREIRRQNPDAEICMVNTICAPTRDRQDALERLLADSRLGVVVVVGGHHSNNTLKLVALCRNAGRLVFHVESASELDPRWFEGVEVVGLTAGTSTLQSTIDQVHAGLMTMGVSGVSSMFQFKAERIS
jgi:4-hydroxy-3-methylbut-2-enyl diphosphate reductase